MSTTRKSLISLVTLASVVLGATIGTTTEAGATKLPPASVRTARTCNDAIATHWPASSQAWARSIVWREAGNQPGAANRSSSARGCWQLLMSLHAKRFYSVGCTPAQWADPDCNTKVALQLFRSSGTRPWALPGKKVYRKSYRKSYRSYRR